MSERSTRTKKRNDGRVAHGRYVSIRGNYLAVSIDRWGAPRVVWRARKQPADVPVGRHYRAWTSEQPVEPEALERWTADMAVASLTLGRDRSGFYFDTKEDAKAALRAANRALGEGGVQWPEWARLAFAAGWTPPNGWAAQHNPATPKVDGVKRRRRSA